MLPPINNINNRIPFRERKKIDYKASTNIKEELAVIGGGLLVGGIPGAIYCKSKNYTGKKFWWNVVEIAAAVSSTAYIIYLSIHPYKRVGENDKNDTTDKQGK